MSIYVQSSAISRLTRFKICTSTSYIEEIMKALIGKSILNNLKASTGNGIDNRIGKWQHPFLSNSQIRNNAVLQRVVEYADTEV